MVKKWIAVLLAATLLMGLSTAVAPALAAAADIEILEAEYGQLGDKRDVTAAMKAKLVAGAVAEFTVSDTELGCAPAGEKDNYLRVKYTQNGVQKYASIKEGNAFALPYKYEVEQTAATKALLAEPLATTTEEKVWPSTGMRGFNFGGLIGSFSANPGNEGQYVSEELFIRLKDMGVNCLRIPIARDSGYQYTVDNIPEDDPMAPYRHTLEAFRVALKLAEKYEMWIIPSGDGVVGRDIDIMYNSADGSGYNKTLTELWVHIAKTYGNHPRLIGYDLLNEPNTANDVAYYTDTLLPMLVKAIRAVDKNTYLIVEPATFAMPGYFANLKPLDDPKTAYSFHFYWPHQYTHQHIGDYINVTQSYPGVMGNFLTDAPILWNRAQMKESVQAVVEFQKKYNVPIWIGEFGVVRWAGNAAQWIRDAISVWEEYGWDWCFHSFGGYNGFNPTFEASVTDSNINDGGVETELVKALREGFAYNKTTNREPVKKPTSTTTTTTGPAATTTTGAAQPDVSQPDAEPQPDNETQPGPNRIQLTASGVTVTLPSETAAASLQVQRLTEGDTYTTIRDSLPAGTSGFAVYQLQVLDAQGAETATGGTAEITIPLSKGMDDVVVYMVDANGLWIPLEAYIYEGKISFESAAMGNFVILKTVARQTVSAPMSGGLIALIVIDCVVAAAGIAVGVFFLVRYLKAKKQKG